MTVISFSTIFLMFFAYSWTQRNLFSEIQRSICSKACLSFHVGGYVKLSISNSFNYKCTHIFFLIHLVLHHYLQPQHGRPSNLLWRPETQVPSWYICLPHNSLLTHHQFITSFYWFLSSKILCYFHLSPSSSPPPPLMFHCNLFSSLT